MDDHALRCLILQEEKMAHQHIKIDRCLIVMCSLVLVLAEATSPAPHDTIWENVGLILLLAGAALIYLCYRFAFKIKAKCLVVGSTTNAPCPLDGSVVLGCKRHHRWRKPVAWLRHLGGAKWLDPWLYRLHIVPPSFVPMPMPVVRSTSTAGSVLTAPNPNLVAPPAPSRRMSPELRIAAWSLAFGVIQAATGIVALAIAS